MNIIRPISWDDGAVQMLDQRRLPGEEIYHTFESSAQTALAIRAMIIRGAPAIGIAAAMSFAQAFRWVGGQGELPVQPTDADPPPPEVWEADKFTGLDKEAAAGLIEEQAKKADAFLRTMRPTAVNLFWACDRQMDIVRQILKDSLHGSQAPLEQAGTGGAQLVSTVYDRLKKSALEILAADETMCDTMATFGADYIWQLLPEKQSDGLRVLTHCNTGALATGGIGTALGVIYKLAGQKRLSRVWVDETRPYLQGARLTAWELSRAGIDHRLISDNMAGHAMKEGLVDFVVVGADRIAANGDTANKIGTYALAVLCRHHNIPFFVAAPVYTIDYNCPHGDQIPIEERAGSEVTQVLGAVIAPAETEAWHPAFDVTPAELITAIISEKGVLPPDMIGKWK